MSKDGYKGNQNSSIISREKLDLYKRVREMNGSNEQAAKFAGVAAQTIYNWKNRGQKLRDEIFAGEKEEKDLSKNEKLYFEFIYIYDNAITGLENKLFNNLIDASTDRMYTDKDGITRIDKPISVPAALAVLKKINPEGWREKEEKEVQEVKHFVKFHNVKDEEKDDVVEKMKAAQRLAVESLKKKDKDN